MEKALRPTLFAGMLLLATYLRVTGLTWGLNSGYGHALNFQPDEFLSLRGVREIDLLRGQLSAPSAYWEGTFNYYLWAIPKAVLEVFSKKPLFSTGSTNASDIGDLLYICRWMTVLFDLAAVIIVFVAIREATRNFSASLLGALVYAILPMEVIYAHYMRPHVLSNLLCSLSPLVVDQSQKKPTILAVVHTGSDLRIGSSNTVSYRSNRFYPVPFHNIRTVRGLQLQRAPAVAILKGPSRGSSLATGFWLRMRPLCESSDVVSGYAQRDSRGPTKHVKSGPKQRI